MVVVLAKSLAIYSWETPRQPPGPLGELPASGADRTSQPVRIMPGGVDLRETGS